ncbi:MAG: porin [Leadbetterella sp.]|nr:porin [Leadbetterella sp.]
MRILLLLLFYSVALFPVSAGSLPDEKKAEDPPAGGSPLKLSGYVDSYYFYNFNGVTSNLGASGFERIFDHNANSFQVGMAQLKTTYTTNKVEGVIDLAFGNHGDLGNYGNAYSPLGMEFGSSGLAIKQAYISWLINDKFKLTAGQYGTNIGYEVIDAPVNFNYSLSNLFGNGPFYHTGIKLDYAVSDKFGLMVGVTDGLDTKEDFNKKKGIQAQVFFQPLSDWSVYLNYFGSDEGVDEKNYSKWFDLATSYQITKTLMLGLNATAGSNAVGKWSGAAFYTNYRFSELFSLGARLEHFNNKEGGIYLKDADGNGVATTGITLTGSFNISPNLMIKPEYRFDTYNHGKFETFQLPGKDGTLSKNSQSTLGAAMIFYF